MIRDYYLLVRFNGDLVRKGSGQGPCIYYSLAKAKQYGPQQAYWEIRHDSVAPKILHVSFANVNGHVAYEWLELP